MTFRLHPKQLIAFSSKATEILYRGPAGGGNPHLMRAAAISGFPTCTRAREKSALICWPRKSLRSPMRLARMRWKCSTHAIIDTRKWLASKLAPRKYGDRAEHDVRGGIATNNSRPFTGGVVNSSTRLALRPLMSQAENDELLPHRFRGGGCLA